MGVKKLVRPIRRFGRKIREYNFNKKRTLTVSKICKISGIELPSELKSIADKPVSTVTRSWYDIEPDFILFCSDINRLEEDIRKKVLENALCIFSEVPVSGCNNIVVSDSLRMYTNVIKYIKEVSDPFVISVTGSIGKTSTKDVIASVLREKYNKKKLFVSSGNSNSHYRIALNIKNLASSNKLFLQEVGIGRTTILVEECARMLEPSVVVYTNILDSHIEYYKSRENIAKYKTMLSKYGKHNGVAIINYDDEILRNFEFEQKVISYSVSDSHASYYAKNIEITEKGTTFTIVSNIDNSEEDVKLQVFGEHHVSNALAAFAVGKYMKISVTRIKDGLFKYKTTGMRGNLLKKGNFKIFADCYNASFDSIEAAARTIDIVKLDKGSKKIAVVADVKELGDFSVETHHNIGKALAKHDIDILIFFGEDMKYAYEEYSKIKKGGIYFNDRDKMHDYLEENAKYGDLILFKGSHSMHLTDTIDIVFGTNMADRSNISATDYEVLKDGDYEINKFPCYDTIIKYSGNLDSVKIPDKIAGQKVAKIASSLFENSSLKKICLPKYLSILNERLFMNSELEEITFNNKLKGISRRAFYGCKNLTEVKLPSSLIFIGRLAFARCTNLKKVYIPSFVSEIKDDAFKNCEDLVIYCDKGSYAYNFAKEKNIKVKQWRDNL
ncbi:MAG: Mur ligase family protein [bacterium]|nr:Mur ligase family protein [bacterium]